MTQVNDKNTVLQNNWSLGGNNTKKPPEKQEKKLENLGEIVVGKRIEEFFSEVSVAGLKYVVIAGAMYIRKAIWLLCVLGGLGFMIYQFHDRISYFLSNPTTVKVSIELVEELEFPTVTLCNENLISKSRTDSEPDVASLITDIYPPWPDNTFTPSFNNMKAFENRLNIRDWSEIWLSVAPFSDRSAWSYCLFNGEPCNVSSLKLVSTKMGFCAQFNGVNSSYTSTLPGFAQGFWMVVNISQNDYLYANSRMAGLRVAVHEKHEVPSFNQYSIKAAPGYITSIGMNKRTITDLAYPYTNCSDQGSYSNQQCLQTCYEMHVTDECNCSFPYFASHGYSTCDPQEMYECAIPKTTEFQNQNLAKNLCSCSEQCVNTKYLFTISSAPFSEYSIRTTAEDNLKEALCNPNCRITEAIVEGYMTQLRRDIVEVEVFFQDFKVEEIVTQKAYTTLALLCDIGGALGLILGATILTLVEILDFTFVLLYDFIRYKIAKRNKRNWEVKEQKKF